MGTRLRGKRMVLDWTLASLHHLAIFSLVAVLAMELAMTAGEIDAHTVGRLAGVDAWFGIMAALTLAVGVARVFLGAKGPEYYVANSLFWVKMALFALVGVVSIMPTLRFLRWRRAARRDPGFRPDRSAILGVRRALYSEAVLVACIPIAAAGMARGFGL